MAWIALITIIGIPLGIWLINRIPSILTLRPRTRTWELGQDAEGRTVISERGRPQVAWLIRGVWFVLVGWWASAIWMGLAWLDQLTVIGLPAGPDDVQPHTVCRLALSLLIGPLEVLGRRRKWHPGNAFQVNRNVAPSDG